MLNLPFVVIKDAFFTIKYPNPNSLKPSDSYIAKESANDFI